MNLLLNRVVNKLRKKKLTISIVESCTGGLLSSYLISIPKVSEIYHMGLIAYSNKSKNLFLNIPKKFPIGSAHKYGQNNIIRKGKVIKKPIFVSFKDFNIS